MNVLWTYRSSLPQMFLWKGVLRMSKCDFNKAALRLYWNYNSAWVLSCKFAIYFQDTFSKEHLWMAAPELRNNVACPRKSKRIPENSRKILFYLKRCIIPGKYQLLKCKRFCFSKFADRKLQLLLKIFTVLGSFL